MTYFITKLLLLFFEFLSLAMILRAVLSWILSASESAIMVFLAYVTEPVILPLRRLCDRFDWFQGVPLDMPFLLTTLLVSLAMSVLRGLLYG